MSAWPGPIRRQQAIAFGFTALIPMLAALWLSRAMVRHATERLRVPEVSARLDSSLELYRELTVAVKRRMRAEAHGLALDPELQRLAVSGEPAALRGRLDQLRAAHPDITALELVSGDRPLATSRRGTPVDPRREHSLDVEELLGGGAPRPPPEDPDDERAAPKLPRLRARFVVDRARFDELEGASAFVEAYQRLAGGSDEGTYAAAFAALLGISVVAAVAVGTLLARGVAVRIERLAAATARVARGDLTARLPTTGGDELTELARSFNRMVGELAASRSRIEYLQRLGMWQEMARRLAHEIKNPLTPIQLAVQEVHRRCPPNDPAFRKLVDLTLEVVEDEVGTLRRLVTEFSDFARLPRAALEPVELPQLLQEQRERLATGQLDPRDSLADLVLPADAPPFELVLERSAMGVHVLLDRQLFRRALVNLLRNAREAWEGVGRTSGRLQLTLGREEDVLRLDVDDDGPGVPEELLSSLFEPYVTGRTDGTGLGLAIVKKIVVDHGGTIEAGRSPLGGARFRLELPVAGSEASRALLEEEADAPASRRRDDLSSAP